MYQNSVTILCHHLPTFAIDRTLLYLFRQPQNSNCLVRRNSVAVTNPLVGAGFAKTLLVKIKNSLPNLPLHIGYQTHRASTENLQQGNFYDNTLQKKSGIYIYRYGCT
jgi:hypothetical protein